VGGVVSEMRGNTNWRAVQVEWSSEIAPTKREPEVVELQRRTGAGTSKWPHTQVPFKTHEPPTGINFGLAA